MMQVTLYPRKYGRVTAWIEKLRDDPRHALLVPSVARKVELIRQFNLDPNEAARILTPPFHPGKISAVEIFRKSQQKSQKGSVNVTDMV